MDIERIRRLLGQRLILLCRMDLSEVECELNQNGIELIGAADTCTVDYIFGTDTMTLDHVIRVASTLKEMLLGYPEHQERLNIRIERLVSLNQVLGYEY